MNKLYLDDLNFEDYGNALNINYKSDKKLTFKRFTDAVILPMQNQENNLNHIYGGVVDSAGEYVENSGISRYGTWKYIYGKYDFDSSKLKKIDREVYYIGPQFSHWGHFLLECITRLWYYLTLSQEERSKIVFAYLGAEITENYLEFFNLLGISKEQLLRITEPTKFSSVIVPEVSSELVHYYTDEYKMIFDNLISAVSPEKYKKIYFTRSEFYDDWQKCRGEDIIENLFRKNGYKIFAPEQLTLQKQIALIKGCKEFASLNSSNSHNLLFSNGNCKVCLLNKCNIVNHTQIMINQIKNIDASYVDINKNLLPVSQGMGPFLLYTSDNLKHFCHDNKLKYIYSSVKNEDYLWYFSYWAEVNKAEWIHPHIQRADFQECIKLINYHLPIKDKKLKGSPFFCRLMSKITFGKLKQKFKDKYKILKKYKTS